MTYVGEAGGGDGSTFLPQGGRVDFWTFDAVQERLIDAMGLWRRSPGGGKWPFAGDAPWHLMTRSARLAAGEVKGMDLARLLLADDDEETRQWQGRERPSGLTRDEVARRDEASEWLGMVPDRDRKLVILALAELSAGRSSVSWMRMKAQLGVAFGVEGLRKRYSRAISGIANALNGGGPKLKL